ncbi:UbiH/UbiF/VisC/COQ6 family ubiquinone biosynthesis hydroxylase [Sphingosinicella soli]|uniref:2-octaprenyl-6-methoxyphenol hydroxylase n=1 Tax=Sphingosinicella soli TaxID=333708 RepID=A0A7W7F7F1_9SPHN|nr:UbiH/UbiF/VisC/COQ6 family ubiquinone biosynthesis hydroxylase [Sphingosinicella soli]MBB4633605.1 2-octaprenyl-6-methoxyphenol hydroxylase [Sphingosinicella soli]
MRQTHDTIIIGGGLVGMTTALALAASGIRCAVIDSADLETTLAASFDGRASAIASATWRMLTALGLDTELAPKGCPIREIRVTDGLSPLHLHFDDAGAETDEPLGYMFENRHLRAALIAAGAASPLVDVHAPDAAATITRGDAGVTVHLARGGTLSAPLLVAADGRRSKIREEAGIRIAAWRYYQTAIVGMIEHEVPHGNVAFELFYPAGPFAVLPMLPGTRSAIVWTVRERDAAATLALPERAFVAEVEKRMGGFLGSVRLAAKPGSFPLGFHHAARYTDRRLILVGDSAHGMHPIAGQGLNLGLRDAAALADVLAEAVRLGLDPGDPQVLARYQRWRGFDSMSVMAATDVLNRLFAIPGRPAAAVRRLGLAGVHRMPPLKRFFMAEARGASGDLPSLLRGDLP